MNKYDFTDEQKLEIGETVCNSFAANIQTGFRTVSGVDDPVPYIAIQMTPNGRVRFLDFLRDGTVIEDRVIISKEDSSG